MEREKVIKSLETCSNVYYGATGACSGCSFSQSKNCFSELVHQTIALLKEQEAVKPVRDKETGRFWLCGNCGQYVGYEDNDPSDPNEFDNYCRGCGRAVKWND